MQKKFNKKYFLVGVFLLATGVIALALGLLLDFVFVAVFVAVFLERQ